ncbi:MAG: ribosome silencing factor [Planctomycetes bacterium]|nr:ribosome silencing factor [Planctomycetota bacterium]
MVAATEATWTPRAVACEAAAIAERLRGERVVVLDVRRLTTVADYFVLATGQSRTQVRAMAAEVESAAKRHAWSRGGVEGREQGWWVLLDLGRVLAHLFQPDAREFYSLEFLWGDAAEVAWNDPAVTAAPEAAVQAPVTLPDYFSLDARDSEDVSNADRDDAEPRAGAGGDSGEGHEGAEQAEQPEEEE